MYQWVMIYSSLKMRNMTKFSYPIKFQYYASHHVLLWICSYYLFLSIDTKTLAHACCFEVDIAPTWVDMIFSVGCSENRYSEKVSMIVHRFLTFAYKISGQKQTIWVTKFIKLLIHTQKLFDFEETNHNIYIHVHTTLELATICFSP